MYDKRAFRGKAAIDGAWSPAPKATVEERPLSRSVAIVLGFMVPLLLAGYFLGAIR